MRCGLLRSMIPGVCQSLSVTRLHAASLCKCRWTDRGPAWGGDSWGPEEPIVLNCVIPFPDFPSCGLRQLLWPTPSQRRSGMALGFKGSHSLTCHPTCLSTNGMKRACLCLRSRSWSSFTDPGRMEGWVGLGTTVVSKQSAQDRRYVTEITVISCSDRHASPGYWKRSRLWASNSRPLGP